jgi:hypothetical protein
MIVEGLRLDSTKFATYSVSIQERRLDIRVHNTLRELGWTQTINILPPEFDRSLR